MKDDDQENSRNYSHNKLIILNNSNREINNYSSKSKRRETIINLHELKKDNFNKNNESLNIITGNYDSNTNLVKIKNNNLKKNNFFDNNNYNDNVKIIKVKHKNEI